MTAVTHIPVSTTVFVLMKEIKCIRKGGDNKIAHGQNWCVRLAYELYYVIPIQNSTPGLVSCTMH